MEVVVLHIHLLDNVFSIFDENTASETLLKINYLYQCKNLLIFNNIFKLVSSIFNELNLSSIFNNIFKIFNIYK